MREILPGVFHWTAFHEPIGARVSSHYVQSAGIVIDPKVPEEGIEALPGEPRQVVLTSGHHQRDAQLLADRFAIQIRASREAVAHLGDEAPEIQTFGDGEQISPGVTAIHIGRLSPDEGALHLTAGDGALVFADGLMHDDGTLGFVSDKLLGEDPERVKRELRQTFKALLELDFDNLLFAHSEPLIGGGKDALSDFVEE
jgi:hypothetical protein